MRRVYRRLTGTALLLTLLLPVCFAAPPSTPSLESYLQERIAAAGLPGASLAVVQDGGVVRTAVTGVTDLTVRRPVTQETVYAIGSVTKSVTATAVLQLRDGGKLELDAPVRRYLPWFRLADDQTADRITLRQLLTHTSGLPANAHAVVWRAPERIRPSLSEGVKALATVWPIARPGERFVYSNMNYAVLGLVVEQVSGLPYPEYIRRHILAPLTMHRSAAAVSDLRGLDVATPYAPSFGKLREAALESGAFHGPAYLLFASAPDLARYAAAHLEPGSLLSATALDEAHAAAVPTGPGMAYGLGWIREEMAGSTVLWHIGGSGHSAFVALIPERKQALVLLTGAYSGESTTTIGKGLVHLLLGQQPPAPGLLPNPELAMDQAAVALLFAGLALLGWWGWVAIRRGRQSRLGLGGLTIRAVLLNAGATSLWWAAVMLPRRFALPAPFGWFGYPPDLLLTLGVWLLAATLWAVWAVDSLFHHRRLLLQTRTD